MDGPTQFTPNRYRIIFCALMHTRQGKPYPMCSVAVPGPRAAFVVAIHLKLAFRGDESALGILGHARTGDHIFLHYYYYLPVDGEE